MQTCLIIVSLCPLLRMPGQTLEYNKNVDIIYSEIMRYKKSAYIRLKDAFK